MEGVYLSFLISPRPKLSNNQLWKHITYAHTYFILVSNLKKNGYY